MSICSAHQTSDPNCDLCKVTITPAEIDLAAEIKRLEAENAELKSIALSRGLELKDAAYDEELCREEFARLRARIALLESALGLPEGCDPFNFERAENDCARDASGCVWRYETQNAQGEYCFSKSYSSERVWFDANGVSLPAFGRLAIRLYCRKEANK